MRGIVRRTEDVLLPRNLFAKAADYCLTREKSLRVFLECPDVPLGNLTEGEPDSLLPWRGRRPVATLVSLLIRERG